MATCSRAASIIRSRSRTSASTLMRVGSAGEGARRLRGGVTAGAYRRRDRQVALMSRRQADADADGRRGDVDEARPAFSDPCNVRAVEIAVELVTDGHRPASFIDAQDGRAQTRNLHNVSDGERCGSNDPGGSDREQRDLLLNELDRYRTGGNGRLCGER